ncbi:hypothetical protein C1H46_036613 [Malus baccata]|uniref:Uncharacterized protein n=1 Tax=Malus baccata TaxID=106549 RepID=A0A540KUE9_MALBA|nr:hypothetical protein C1H46_036613 [Malus baccata]
MIKGLFVAGKPWFGRVFAPRTYRVRSWWIFVFFGLEDIGVEAEKSHQWPRNLSVNFLELSHPAPPLLPIKLKFVGHTPKPRKVSSISVTSDHPQRQHPDNTDIASGDNRLEDGLKRFFINSSTESTKPTAASLTE